MQKRAKTISYVYILALLAGIVAGSISVNFGKWTGRWYSVDKDHDVNMLVLVSFQASLAIDSLETYYGERGGYPDELEELSIAEYPDYIDDTFLSNNENYRFPRFVYNRQRELGSEETVDYYTLSAELGSYKLVYDSRQQNWVYFQPRIVSERYEIPNKLMNLSADAWSRLEDRALARKSGDVHELKNELQHGGQDALPVERVALENWTSSTTGMKFVWIPQMDMWVGKHEVTNAEYRIKEPGHHSGDFEGHTLNQDRQPVVHVTFDEIVAYTTWMSNVERKTGLLPSGYSFRLPSGQEWMTFAQCGDGREYPWGNAWPPPLGQAGNYHGMEGAGSWGRIKGYNDGYPVTARVDELWENPWGLKGVGGNVWEACADLYMSGRGWRKAWRGASWSNFSDDYLRCRKMFFSHRGNIPHNNAGFRLVLAPEQQAEPAGGSAQ